MTFEKKQNDVNYALWAVNIALWMTIGLYAFMGIYSRYLADDYCEAMRVSEASSPLAATIQRYMTPGWPRETMRYSNILFVGISELLGKYSMQLTIPLLIVLWGVGLTWLLHEVRLFFDLKISLREELFLSSLLVFISFLMSSDLFQVIYWRSSAMTHFAPLVLGSFFCAFLIKMLRQDEKKPVSIFVYIGSYFISFLLAGFSEPPVTVAITACVFLLIFFYFWDTSKSKNRRLILLSITLAGVISGLAAMFLSPAVGDYQRGEPVNMVAVLLNSFLYSLQFMLDLVKSFPLPLAVCLLLPGLFFWVYSPALQESTTRLDPRKLWMVILLIFFIVWILIAASFSPSVYGQGYPAGRARFLGSSMFVAFIIFLGASLGIIFANYVKPVSASLQKITIFVFVLIGVIYPLRRDIATYSSDLPENRTRAMYWDLRYAQIQRKIANGETDLQIPAFSGIHGIKELDLRTNFVYNVCAAKLYGANSISTYSVQEKDFMEALSE
ncbi:MAG: DUF6056 family protein [Anaerolineales bacterium]